MTNDTMPRLQKIYREEIRGKMQEKFGYSNPMQIPGVTKVVLNMGLGKEAMDNANNVTNAQGQMEMLAGQKSVVAKARVSVAGFRLREGVPIGVFTTLRGARMWEFLDRLINFSLPQVRDFRGLSPKGFDGRGNYNFGVEEQAIFPEIDVDKIDKFRGMNITIVTTAETDEEGQELIRLLGMPFRRSGRGGA
ncbi:MAG TPA: 50S ribosomal protein L5 [Candidatus Sabulitectum sp.]|jgi:large subunit ribosomal protein L5|nr:50S ribosomal protein L5 [Candidatus Sabulitectum sp.]HPF31512.1 50S ribosomal protein L5 [Candidatus Sabulitectum sp.]HPJ27955.1 50S ribosomal protein L5 [Candidatus Sabulitectum sp.]HPR21758.1 50S ribosomal protein L5 [Candidatus Sabulitectum sp.]HRW78782.1 50S ribosomal protein L5 [Candidatus Sabulitectum sp.]